MNKIGLFFFLFLPLLAVGQERYYTDPLKIPLSLSGSFAELRTNHFHSGIDIKTQGVTGLPVVAVTDGFVSRIAVSPTGFGKALYIDHSNGTTSVYGHLDRFSPEIQKYVTDQQYQQASFRVDLKIPPFLFPVKKGGEIAKSGNSGSSGGPHLHFEIRDTQSEEPLNPLDFGFSVVDNIAPEFYSLLVVPLSETAAVDGQAVAKSFPLVLANGKYQLSNASAIKTSGPVGFAVQANDFFDGSSNRCGINRLQLSVDGEAVFAFSLDRFSFDDSRFINSHIVYDEYIESGRRFIKTWIDPGNRLPVYTYNLSQGVFVSGKSGKKVEIELADAYGNTAFLKFNTTEGEPAKNLVALPEGKKMDWKRDNHFKSDNCELEIPEGALYKDLLFTYREDPASAKYYSDFQRVHSNHVPLHTSGKLRIRARNLPPNLESKALVVNLDTRDGRPSALGGTFANGWLETEIRSLGMYALMVDTLAPSIVPLSLSEGKLTETSRLRFKISDDLSGIKSIEGRIDGKWALFDYDAKNNRIVHHFDPERFEMGKRHDFVLQVIDFRDNRAEYKTSFWK